MTRDRNGKKTNHESKKIISFLFTVTFVRFIIFKWPLFTAPYSVDHA